MATPGSPWVCDKSHIVEALKKANGRITHACKELNVAYITLKKRIDADEELIQLVSDLRNHFENSLLDIAEDCISQAMQNLQTDAANAIKSAIFTLNSRGKDRGWSNTLLEGNKPQKIEFTVNYPNDSQPPIKVLPETVSNSDSSGAQ